MNLFKLLIIVFAFFATLSSNAQRVDKVLQKKLEEVYQKWRKAMIQKDHQAWKSLTSLNRQVLIYNRIVSSHQSYPGQIYNVPFAPPSLLGLKAVNVNSNGATATATYYGRVNFSVGGDPSENLVVQYYVKEKGKWKYDTADFINLMALPDVRKQLKAGNYSYVTQKDFMASGIVPKIPRQITERGYIAKVFSFCPGREVKVEVNNGISKHKFQNTQAAEVIIGGVKKGVNPISLSISSLPGSNGKEALDVRVFLMSRVKGVKPVNVFQYRITPKDIAAGKRPASKSRSVIRITSEHLRRIHSKPNKK